METKPAKLMILGLGALLYAFLYPTTLGVVIEPVLRLTPFQGAIVQSVVSLVGLALMLLGTCARSMC